MALLFSLEGPNREETTMKNTRQADLEELKKEYNSADNRGKKAIEEAAHKITNETGKVKSMRERLLKEHRAGRVENIKDIHERIKNKKEYQNI